MYYDRNVSQIIRLWEEILAETIIDSYLVEEKLWVVEEIRLTPLVWWPFQWSSWRSESIPERGIDTYKAAILIWKIDKKFTEWYLRERNQEDIPQTKWEDSIKWCGRIARKPNCPTVSILMSQVPFYIRWSRWTEWRVIRAWQINLWHASA